ncbi:MAG: DEAD/DEAH box helicase, partial [Gluconacetobacter diazotrophicus]|nr:DEAD/DEAH box helicase [Gluconacetobacter diazotrophicus]
MWSASRSPCTRRGGSSVPYSSSCSASQPGLSRRNRATRPASPPSFGTASSEPAASGTPFPDTLSTVAPAPILWNPHPVLPEPPLLSRRRPDPRTLEPSDPPGDPPPRHSPALAPAAAAGRAPVLLPYPFPGPFDYATDPAMPVEPGDAVLVPLNRRTELGVVWDPPEEVFRALPPELHPPGSPPVAASRLKPVAAVLDIPRMSRPLRRFIDWMAGYTVTPPGLVLAMALRPSAALPTAPAMGWIRSGSNSADARVTPARERVLRVLADGIPRDTASLAREAAASPAVIRAMAEKNLLRECVLPVSPPFASPDPDHVVPTLSPEQETVADQLATFVRARRFQPVLLDGPTGSGKTETYLEAVAACLSEGRQALVLLPEIALSSQWLDRFRRRFGVEPAVWHSDLGSKRRRITWRAVSGGEAPVVVGARSALFLPFPDLGLVIVDEEHETAFKQEDGVTYHARDMAVV